VPRGAQGRPGVQYAGITADDLAVALEKALAAQR
jgi:hypothetical protein